MPAHRSSFIAALVCIFVNKKKMWLIIPIVVVLVLLPFLYLLFAPFYIEIDSRSGLCRLRMHRLASADIRFVNASLYLRIRILSWQKEYDLLALKPQSNREVKQTADKPAEAEKGKADKSETGFRYGFTWPRIRAMIGSFRISNCHVVIDTGDMPLNATLYPWFYMLGQEMGQTVMINFRGENEIALAVENNIARILWAWARAGKD
jgi:hypothetical protein